MDKLKKFINKDRDTIMFLCNFTLFILGLIFAFSTTKKLYLIVYTSLWFITIYLKAWIESNYDIYKFKLELKKIYENYITHNVILILVLSTFIESILKERSTNVSFLILIIVLIGVIMITILLINPVNKFLGSKKINTVSVLSFISCISIFCLSKIYIHVVSYDLLVSKIITIVYISDTYNALISILDFTEDKVNNDYKANKYKKYEYMFVLTMLIVGAVIRVNIVFYMYNSNFNVLRIIIEIMILSRLIDHMNSPKDKLNCINIHKKFIERKQKIKNK